MRIRTQIALGLVPLFAVFSLVTGLLRYSLQTRESAWGMREESTSIAVALAQFMNAGMIATNGAADDPRLQKVMEWGRARRITFLAEPDMKIVFDICSSNAVSESIMVPASLRTAVAKEEVYVSDVQTGRNGGGFFMACAPVRLPGVSGGGGQVGILAVETSAQDLLDLARRLRRSILSNLIATSVLGLMLAMVVSGMMTRRINHLVHLAQAAERGNYETCTGTGVVQEINDLGNTFNTMSSVLKDVMDKTRRMFVDFEQFRDENSLVEAYHGHFHPLAAVTQAGMEIGRALVGPNPAGAFADSWETPGGGCAVVGRIREGNGLRAALSASAFLGWLRTETNKNEPLASVILLTSRVPVSSCMLVSWDRKGAVTEYSLNSSSGEWKTSRVAGNVPLVVAHTLDTAADGRLRRYAAQFEQPCLDAMAKEMALVIDPRVSGGLILLRRVS